MEAKICGITNAVDAIAAADCGADALGFIFHEPSPRYVSPEKARAIIESVPGVCKVGVFVNLDPALVRDISDFCGLDLMQLHGDESPEYCKLLPSSRLIKAVAPRSVRDLDRLNAYDVHAFLIDSRTRGLYGGTGKKCDWDLAAMIAKDRPLILSGGLGPESINEAILKVQPRAVDINSSIEATPGIKDIYKMKEIMEAIRALEESLNGPDFIFRKY